MKTSPLMGAIYTAIVLSLIEQNAPDTVSGMEICDAVENALRKGIFGEEDKAE